jgi:hypothetical protein
MRIYNMISSVRAQHASMQLRCACRGIRSCAHQSQGHNPERSSPPGMPSRCQSPARCERLSSGLPTAPALTPIQDASSAGPTQHLQNVWQRFKVEICRLHSHAQVYCMSKTMMHGTALHMTWSGLSRSEAWPHLLRDLVRYLHEASSQGQERADIGNVPEAAACRRTAGACQLCHAFCGLGLRLFFFCLHTSMNFNTLHAPLQAQKSCTSLLEQDDTEERPRHQCQDIRAHQHFI